MISLFDIGWFKPTESQVLFYRKETYSDFDIDRNLLFSSFACVVKYI